MTYRIIADALLVGHLAFVCFVVLGGFLVVNRRGWAWIHAPLAAWGVLVELGGWVCPLTPLEIHYRILGGQQGYGGGFIAHYLMPILYPGSLTREHQLLMAFGVLALNLLLYGIAFTNQPGREG